MDIKDIISSGLLELYVLGMASEQETAQVIELAKNNPEVAAEIKAIENSLQDYSKLHAVIPAPSVKEKVFAEINNESQRSNSNTIETAKIVSVTSAWKYAAAAAILLLIGSIVLNITYYNKYEKANKDYEAAVSEKNNAQDQLAALEQSNNDMKTDMSVVHDKNSYPVSLAGQPDAPEAAAKIFWMKNTSGEVYIDPSNLPDAPEGMQYQFWGFVDGKPVDGGMIVFDKKGDKYRIQKMKTFGKAEAFAVTLETKGGHPQPQGKIFVMGKM